MEVRTSHSAEPVETDSVRIKVNGYEYMLKQIPEGLHIIEITNEDIIIRPQTGNSIVIVTRK